MKAKLFAIILVAIIAVPVVAQVQTIFIPAGTPEDQAIQAIVKENDDAKRLAMWEEFVAKFPSNGAAVAYGNSQIAQFYLSSNEPSKAMAYGEKALAPMPNNLDTLQLLTMAAQQMKDDGKALHYSCLGGKAINGIKTTPRPENLSEADWKVNLDGQRQQVQQQYELFESAGYNAVANEQSAKKRVGYAQEYMAAFPDSRYADQVHQFAITGFQQLNDYSGAAKYGEKAIAANPNNVATLSLLAYALAEDPKNAYLPRCMEYARKAIDIGKADSPDTDQSIKLSVGLAYSALGYALMKQEKTAAAIPEFKNAMMLLKSEPSSYEVVLYRIGYAYAKLKRYDDARASLNEAIALKGPFEQPSKDLLGKINTASKAR